MTKYPRILACTRPRNPIMEPNPGCADGNMVRHQTPIQSNQYVKTTILLQGLRVFLQRHWHDAETMLPTSEALDVTGTLGHLQAKFVMFKTTTAPK